ncbi:MAG: branched-chain amino acid ABC transporter permease [Spirochaetaceae bacterium]|nr:MAG: branched-chain amino acid ABC transporter permease [Spirochaetaceae bacterium]
MAVIKLFLTGLVAAVPIATGYVPVAITFGILVVGTGLHLLDAVLASAIVFAGATQIMAIGMYGGLSGASGPAVVQIVVAGWLLNLRHLLMSSVIAHTLAAGPAGQPRRAVRSLVAFGVTDEVFSVASLHAARGETLRPAFLLGLEFGAYAAWVGGTALGATLGEILPRDVRGALGLALYALFAALLAGQFRAAGEKRSAVPLVTAATTAAAANVLFRLVLGMGAGSAFPLAMTAGALAGWIAATWIHDTGRPR